MSPQGAVRTTLKHAQHDSAAVRRAQSHQKDMRNNPCTSADAHKGTFARLSKQVNRTRDREKALRQQRSDLVRAHRYEGTRRDGIMASDRTAGQDCEDGQKAAKRKAAVAAVGDGAFRTKTSRLTALPPNQRASDSHDYTRLATLKVLNASLRKHTVRAPCV